MSAPIGSPSMLEPLRPSGVQIVTAPLTGHAAAWWLERTSLVLGRVKRMGDVTIADLNVRSRLNRECRLVIIGGPGANEYSRQGGDDDGTWAAFSLEDDQGATHAAAGDARPGLWREARLVAHSLTALRDPWCNTVLCRAVRRGLVPVPV